MALPLLDIMWYDLKQNNRFKLFPQICILIINFIVTFYGKLVGFVYLANPVLIRFDWTWKCHAVRPIIMWCDHCRLFSIINICPRLAVFTLFIFNWWMINTKYLIFCIILKFFCYLISHFANISEIMVSSSLYKTRKKLCHFTYGIYAVVSNLFTFMYLFKSF